MHPNTEAVLTKYSKFELAKIIAELLDGSCTSHEIHYNTGMPIEECERVAAIGSELLTAIYSPNSIKIPLDSAD